MIEISIHYPTYREVGKADKDKVKIEFIAPRRPFLFWGDTHFSESISFPRGYGVAYVVVYEDILRRKLLFAPMPFNILIGGGIWLYHWLRVGFAAWCWRHTSRGKV